METIHAKLRLIMNNLEIKKIIKKKKYCQRKMMKILSTTINFLIIKLCYIELKVNK